MKCGSCKGDHKTVADVRDCYAEAQYAEESAKAEAEAERRNEQWFEERGGAVDDPIEREKWAQEDEELAALRRLNEMTGEPGRNLASDKQVKYVMDLLAERAWPDPIIEDDVRNMERRQVSKLIDQLKHSPKRSDSPVPEVPAGRYALFTEGDTGVSYSYVDRQDLVPFKKSHWDFYQVDVPTEGPHAGRTFLKRLIGAPGDYRKERISGMAMARILTRISENPEEASLNYGKQSGVCGVCRSPLTNDASLARGIGPVCAGKTGWGGAA